MKVYVNLHSRGPDQRLKNGKYRKKERERRKGTDKMVQHWMVNMGEARLAGAQSLLLISKRQLRLWSKHQAKRGHFLGIIGYISVVL